MMVNAEINERLGKPRDQASTEDFKNILESLDDILQPLARKLRKVKGDYERRQT
jgi:DNA repair protein RadD